MSIYAAEPCANEAFSEKLIQICPRDRASRERAERRHVPLVAVAVNATPAASSPMLAVMCIAEP